MHAFPCLQHRSKPEPINLNNLRIASPCPADWEKMVGDERVRHCAECNLNVYNLSAMTERQVQESFGQSRKAALYAFLSPRRRDGSYAGLPVEFACAHPEGPRLGAAS